MLHMCCLQVSLLHMFPCFRFHIAYVEKDLGEIPSCAQSASAGSIKNALEFSKTLQRLQIFNAKDARRYKTKIQRKVQH